MLSLYRALIRLRRASEALLIGDVRLLAATERVLAYERRIAGERMMIALNMTGEEATLQVGSAGSRSAAFDLSRCPELTQRGEIRLRADEGLVLRAPAGDWVVERT